MIQRTVTVFTIVDFNGFNFAKLIYFDFWNRSHSFFNIELRTIVYLKLFCFHKKNQQLLKLNRIFNVSLFWLSPRRKKFSASANSFHIEKMRTCDVSSKTLQIFYCHFDSFNFHFFPLFLLILIGKNANIFFCGTW